MGAYSRNYRILTTHLSKINACMRKIVSEYFGTDAKNISVDCIIRFTLSRPQQQHDAQLQNLHNSLSRHPVKFSNSSKAYAAFIIIYSIFFYKQLKMEKNTETYETVQVAMFVIVIIGPIIHTVLQDIDSMTFWDKLTP